MFNSFTYNSLGFNWFRLIIVEQDGESNDKPIMLAIIIDKPLMVDTKYI